MEFLNGANNDDTVSPIFGYRIIINTFSDRSININIIEFVCCNAFTSNKCVVCDYFKIGLIADENNQIISCFIFYYNNL